MFRLSAVFLIAGLLLGGVAASTAHADSDFTFSSTPIITSASVSPSHSFDVDITTNGDVIGGLPAASFSARTATGTSTITLTGRDISGPFDATFGSNTPFLDVTVTSDDTAVRNFNLVFDVAYTLTDPTPAGGAGPQTVHFTGTLDGEITDGGTGLSFIDFSPALGAGSIVTVGDGAFHVTLDSANDPGLGADQSGGLTARVDAEPTAAPLPSTASALFALLPLLLVGRWGIKAVKRTRTTAI